MGSARGARIASTRLSGHRTPVRIAVSRRDESVEPVASAGSAKTRPGTTEAELPKSISGRATDFQWPAREADPHARASRRFLGNDAARSGAGHNGDVTFFEPPARHPDPVREHRQPPWIGPPENVLGAAVPLRLVLARTDEVALAITDASAYPSGVMFQVALRLRTLTTEMRRALLASPFHLPWYSSEPDGGNEIPPELLRIGVQFADGRKATTLGGRDWGQGEPEGPVLMPHGGGGGERSWDVRLWLWPLPPPGPLVFACEWPLANIPLTTAELDAALICDAAERAELLWPEEGHVTPGGWSGQMLVATSAAEDEPAPPDSPPPAS